GTPGHLSGELLRLAANLSMVHVPYRGAAPALTDLIGGQVQLVFDNLPTSLESIRAGKVRALAVTTAIRAPQLPDLPTVGEFVPGYEVSSWFGIGAPIGTSAEIIEKLNASVNAALADPRIKVRIAELSSAPLPMMPADFGKLIVAETEKWGKVVTTA